LPGNWILGQVSRIAVDKNDHILIVHRPASLLDDEKGGLQRVGNNSKSDQRYA
jgi:hypothetical protein